MATVKIFGCILLALVPGGSECSTEGLDYILRAIEFQINIHSGVFSCVFWDVSPVLLNSYDETLDAILNSNRMENVAKYVVHGTKIKNQNQLPVKPTMLIMYTGKEASYLEQNETQRAIHEFLERFDPLTKLVVLVDHFNELLLNAISWPIASVHFHCVIYYDSLTKQTYHCNGPLYWIFPKSLQFIYLFTHGRVLYKGHPIRFTVNENALTFFWNRIWLYETAKYMNTEAIEYQHDCIRFTGLAYDKCIQECRGNQSPTDIVFFYIMPTIGTKYKTRYDIIMTTIPIQVKIAIPRDRPVNVAELLVMPFSWQVWVVLVVIFAFSEVIKHRFPQVFTNDPTLLAVCGFERNDLNRAGSLEKILFLPLIALMFFMTNAFETKIVSLMISKPAIQRIRTLEDLAKSDLKFHQDLENNPHFANHPINGEMIVNAKPLWFFETDPGVALLLYSDFAQVRLEVSFDFERAQPFYVLLENEFYIMPETYAIWDRDVFTEAFRHIHITLEESGILRMAKQAWNRGQLMWCLGRRPRKVIENKVELYFEDLLPAWVVLIVGFIISGLGFAVEEVLSYFAREL